MVEPTPTPHCDVCNRDFLRQSALIAHTKSKAHIAKVNGLVIQPIPRTGAPLTNQARNEYREYMNNPQNFNDLYRMKIFGEQQLAPYTVEEYIRRYKHEIKESMTQVQRELGFTKFKLMVSLTFYTGDDLLNRLDVEVHTKFIHLFSLHNFKDLFEKIITQLNTNYQITEEELGESSLQLYSINQIQIDYWQTNPFSVRSYIELPFKSKYLVNVKNKDNNCFRWSILAALHPPPENPNRVSNYERFKNELNFEGIALPIQLNDIPKFERQNNLRINIYELLGQDERGRNIIPLYISNSRLENVISLLIIEDEQGENFHYVLIKNFQSFALSQFSNSHCGNQHVCERCFYLTYSENKRILHNRLCALNKPSRIIMPSIKKYEDKDGIEQINDQTKMKFKNYSKLLQPFATIYADFEAVNIKQNLYFQYIDLLRDKKLEEDYTNYAFTTNPNDEFVLVNESLHRYVNTNVNLSKLLCFLSDYEVVIKFPNHLSRYDVLNRSLDYIHRNSLLYPLSQYNYVGKDTDEILLIDENIPYYNEKHNLSKMKEFFRTCGNSYTINLTEQVASSVNIYIKSNYPDLYPSKDFHMRTGESRYTLENFRDYVNWLQKRLYKTMMKNNFPKPHLSSEQEEAFQNATICWMCLQPFSEDLSDKVKDHDHFIEKNNYRGAAHRECNIKCHKPTHIPFFFHNMSGYDIHLFIKSLAENTPKSFKVIGKTMEKYKAVDYGCIRFVDSLAFFGKSLDSVSKSLSNKDFKILLKEFLFPKFGYQLFTPNFTYTIDEKREQGMTDEEIIETANNSDYSDLFKLCRGKGIYPYDHIDSFYRFQERQLPPKEAFYSILYQSDISDEEYERAQSMWDLFKCRNIGEYTDLYLKLDVFILADCFEKFISVFPVNPCNYISAPSLAWDVLLYSSNQTLDLLTDVNMFNVIKNNIRGGISSVMGSRRITAYNKRKDYDTLLENMDSNECCLEIQDVDKFNAIIKAMNDPSYILYIDATALYSGIMTQPMPYGGFKYEYLTQTLIRKVLKTTQESQIGYFIECDLEYPQEIHVKTEYFPFAPIKRKVEYDELSLWQKLRNSNMKTTTEKLICDQHNKSYYLVHYRLLQFYLKHGMKLTKVHSVISFHQSCWMKPYIEKNIRYRDIAKAAKDDFGIDIYKLLNNAVFGKTMENVDKYRDIKLLTSSPSDINQYKKIISKPTFKGATRYTKDLIAVEIGMYEKTYNKPIYLGFSILDLSKLQMYETFYDVLLPHFGNRISMNAMDTDSMFLHIKSNDIYKEIEENTTLKSIINTSGKLFSFKDEKPLTPISEAIFVRAKQYSLKMENDALNEIKNKGIQKCVIKRMNHQNFLDCLESNQNHHEITHGINSDSHHDIYLKKQNKLALTNYDDKRYILPNGISTLPFGSYKIPIEELEIAHE